MTDSVSPDDDTSTMDSASSIGISQPDYPYTFATARCRALCGADLPFRPQSGIVWSQLFVGIVGYSLVTNLVTFYRKPAHRHAHKKRHQPIDQPIVPPSFKGLVLSGHLNRFLRSIFRGNS